MVKEIFTWNGQTDISHNTGWRLTKKNKTKS